MQELSLVTGGAGFIGSHLVEALTAAGRPVRVFDDFSTGMRTNLEKAESAAEIVTGDVADPDAVERAMRGVKVVYHLAALASVARSVETPAVSHRACCTGTVHVLDAARKAGVRRLVFAASSSAYGGASSADGQKEDAPVQPLSPYAAAKLASEMYLQAFARSYAIETVSLRFFNIFGPRQRADSPYSGVIALFIAAMTAGKTPTVHGQQSRDFTYVTNAVQALMKAAEAKGVSGNVYNVGTGSSITVLDLITALNRLLGADLKPQFGEPRAGDVRFSRADISRTRRDLGYNPDVTFQDGLGRTLQWYREVQAATQAA
jgi:UDP-glucose 4-epimerase